MLSGDFFTMILNISAILFSIFFHSPGEPENSSHSLERGETIVRIALCEESPKVLIKCFRPFSLILQP